MRNAIRTAVLARTEFAFGREVTLGFSAAAAARGWIVELIEASQSITAMLRHWDPQVIILAFAKAYDQVPPEMRTGRVFVGTEFERPDLPHIPTLMVDDEAVGRLAAEHFANAGISTVVTIGYGRPGFCERRVTSFSRAAAAHGQRDLGYWDQLPHQKSCRAADAFAPLARFLAEAPRPAGLFCSCDNWARAALTGLRMAGMRIPEDVAVLGVDNDEVMCEVVHPPLSSVAVPWDRMGATAADIAARCLAGEAPPRGRVLVAPTGVIARRSTDVLAVEDADVATAMNYIRQHATTGPVRIADLLRAVPAGRHRLNRAFRAELGRTIMQEVRRVRVEHAKRLLTMTTLPLEEVAERSGYSNYRKLGIAFRAETGDTATNYRKRFSR